MYDAKGGCMLSNNRSWDCMLHVVRLLTRLNHNVDEGDGEVG
jgi:hypothetical protein